MAKRRTRARGSRQGAPRASAPRNEGIEYGAVATVVPRVLVGALDGVEIVAVGALQLTRDVLLTTVTGAANVGAEALRATTAGARGVLSAASRMVGDIAGTAQGAIRDTLYNAQHSRAGAARAALRPSMPARDHDTTASAPARRRRARRQRPAVRVVNARAAA